MDKRTFNQLIGRFERAGDAAARDDLERDLWRRFGVDAAVHVLDMARFSALTRDHGIVSYLTMIRRMQRVVRPIVKRHGGQLVKFAADNAYSRYPLVEGAIRAAIDINRNFAAADIGGANGPAIQVSSGIAYGRVLLAGSSDYFGDPVNIASKLGEDAAEAGEILVSDEAMQQLADRAAFPGRRRRLSLSGLIIDVHAMADD